ncbi:uroporphyrinogen-III synthase [soil metagenome]
MTRALPGAARTAERLRRLGFTPVVAPVLAIDRRENAATELAGRLDGISGFVFTSRNGVSAFAALSPLGRQLPVFAVGDATAQAARDAGFEVVVSAAGDVSQLADTIRQSQLPNQAVLLHPGAAVPAGDLAGTIGDRITLRPWPIYASLAAPTATPPACVAVLVHSPRAGRILAERRAGGERLPLTICAVSQNAAAPLSANDPGHIHIADHPDDDALIACLQAALGKRSPRV